jgi:hypothetical protein
MSDLGPCHDSDVGLMIDEEWLMRDPLSCYAKEFWEATEHDGYLYIIQPENGGAMKIGWTSNLEQRYRQLQCGHPEKLKICFAIQVPTRQYESAVHGFLSEYRLRGEWFWPHPRAIRILRRLQLCEDDDHGIIMTWSKP